MEVAQVSTDLKKVLAHLRGGPAGGWRRTPKAPRGKTPTFHSLTSQEESQPRREERPPR